MAIMVLGASGYLGNKIVHELAKENTQMTIYCVTRNERDIVKWSDIDNENIHWVSTSLEAIKSIINQGKIEWIFNFVCNYGKGQVLYDDLLESNLTFPLQVLNTASSFGVKNYLTIGTCLPETFNMYSFTKRSFSEFGRFYAEKNAINFVELALEMFYGADEPRERFIPGCIYKMLMDEDLELTLGTQKRDVVAIEDVVDAVMFVYHANLIGYNRFDVGTGTAPTIKEMIDFLKMCTNSNSTLHYGVIPMRDNEPDCIANTSELEQLGFRCKISWKDGLQKMANDIKDSKK